jgi:hypothetical protein
VNRAFDKAGLLQLARWMDNLKKKKKRKLR